MERLYKAYKDKAQFYLVYIREAHPVRTSKTPNRYGPGITQHKDIKERVVAATQCIQSLKISLPTLIDEMTGGFQTKYGGFPAGTNIVDLDGKIAFSSRGPWGAKPKEAKVVLDKLIASNGRLSGKATPPAKPAKPAKPAAVKKTK